MEATLSSRGALHIADRGETRIIRPAHPHYSSLMALYAGAYSGASDVSLSTADAPPQAPGRGGAYLAETYAQLWNARPPDPTELETAAAELESGGWVVERIGGAWTAYPVDGDDIELSQSRSPPGGVSIAGRFYRGGLWIPEGELEKATPAVRAKIKAAEDAGRQKRTARGSVDTQALRDKLQAHAHHELTDAEMRKARAAFGALKRHHGDLAVHRLEELSDQLHAALDALPEDEEGQREQFGRRLRAIGAMLDMAKEQGISGEVEAPASRVASYADAEMRVDVHKDGDRFRVTGTDLDSGAALPFARTHATEAEARADAQKILAGGVPGKGKQVKPGDEPGAMTGTLLSIWDQAKRRGITEGEMLAHVGVPGMHDLRELNHEQSMQLERDLKAGRVRAEGQGPTVPDAPAPGSEPMRAAAQRTAEPDAERVLFRGDPYVKRGDKWVNEADPAYATDDAGMERWRKRGLVTEAPAAAAPEPTAPAAEEQAPVPEPPAAEEPAPETPERDAPEPAPRNAEPWAGDAPDHGVVYNAPTEALHVDPKRFQFKLNTENAAGVTDEFSQVRQWNPDFAGVISVWKDPDDGKTYVVNGHHRAELAKRLDVPDMAIRYIDAADAKEARAVGAAVNIAEGRGTAVDAAKFLRDTGLTPEDMVAKGISLKGKVSAEAVVLTKLNDRLFDRVARGTMDQARAIAIAKHLDEPLLQDKLASLLDKREEAGKDFSPKVIEEMARSLRAAGTVKTTEEGGLFGDIEAEESLFEPRAELAAHVRGELSKAVNDFLAVSSKRRAGVIAGAGNVLDTEANRKIAEEADRVKNVYDTFVNRKGPISDALNESAAELIKAKGKKARDAIRERTLERVQSAVFAEAGIGAPPEPGGQGPGADGSQAPPGDGPPGARVAEPGAGDAGRGEVAADGLKPKAPKNLTEAGGELEAIRNDLASAAADEPESLLARVDAVGKWLAGQKPTPKNRALGQEAHALADKLMGGSGKGGNRIQVMPEAIGKEAKDSTLAAVQPPVTPAHVATARRDLAAGKLGAKGTSDSPLVTSALSGKPIRRYVELPGGAKVHPDELARAQDVDGKMELGPEKLGIKDRGHDSTAPSFERALAHVTAQKGGDDDRVTLVSPHGYSVEKTRGEWRGIASGGEAFAQWYDRENPPAVSAAAAGSQAGGASVASAADTERFFAPKTEPGPGLFARPDSQARARAPHTMTQAEFLAQQDAQESGRKSQEEGKQLLPSAGDAGIIGAEVAASPATDPPAVKEPKMPSQSTHLRAKSPAAVSPAAGATMSESQSKSTEPPKSLTKRSGSRNVDAYAVGNTLQVNGHYVIVTGYKRRTDDQGGYEHKMTLRPATPEEAKQGKIAALKAGLRAMGPGPDDDRNRAAHAATERRLDNEIRALEGRPTAEAEAAQKATEHGSAFRASWARGIHDRLGEMKALANRPGQPLHGNVSTMSLAEATGIPVDRLRDLADEDLQPPVTEAEIAAVARVMGVTVEQLRDGAGEVPEVA